MLDKYLSYCHKDISLCGHTKVAVVSVQGWPLSNG